MFSAAAGHQTHLSLASEDSIFHTNFECIILQEIGWSGLPRLVWATVPMSTHPHAAGSERCGWR